MKKYILIFIIALVVIGGCEKESSDNITISWWHFWTDSNIRPVIEEIVSDFEKSHPNVTVELVDLTWADGHDKIAIAFSSGSGPDIVELGSDWIPEFSSTGHLYNITDKIDTLRDNYHMWNPGEYDGKNYAFPWILGTRVMFVNTELLSQAGYGHDYVFHSWIDLLDAANRINNLSDDSFGFGSNSAERHRLYKKFLPFMWANGGRILSEDQNRCLFNSPEVAGALEYYKSLCASGLTDTQRRLEDAFLQGKIGIVISGDWLLKRIAKEKPDIAFTTQIIPGPESLSASVSFAGGEYLCINSLSKYPDLAFELVKHICSKENQLKFCAKNMTPTPSAPLNAGDSLFVAQPYFDTFINQLKTSRMPPPHPQWVYMETEIEKAIEAVIYESKTIPQALDDAAVRIDEILKQ